MSINQNTKARSKVGGLIIGNSPDAGGRGTIATTGDGVTLRKVAQTKPVTITPTASLLAGTVYTTTVTCTGAQLSAGQVADAIIAIPPAALEAGLVYNAYVSATDTITLNIANPTLGNIATSARAWNFLWVQLID